MMASGSSDMASATVSISGKTAPRVAEKIATRAPPRSEKNPLPRSAPVMPWVAGAMHDWTNGDCTRFGEGSRNLDERMAFRDDSANDAGRNSSALHGGESGGGGLRRDRCEQAAGSLRIEEESAKFFGNAGGEFD